MPENEEQIWDRFEEIKGLTAWESAKLHTFTAVTKLIEGNPNSLIWGMLAVENILASKLGDDYFDKIDEKKKELMGDEETQDKEMNLLLSFAKLRAIHEHIDKSTPYDVEAKL